MHSNESAPAASGPALLNQLGRLIVRARSTSPAHAPRRRHKLASNPSTSQQVQSQPKAESKEQLPGVVAQLSNHVLALWNDRIPICIEILLAPECHECYAALCRVEEEAAYDKSHTQQRALLLERWTMRATTDKSHDSSPSITAHWLLNAVRSQLHFSQLSAWRATIKNTTDDKPAERRRKLSRETCNYKKIEANCDETDERKLNLIYSIKIPGESYHTTEFSRPPAHHKFPVTDLGNDLLLNVVLESLPRLDEIPVVKCTCPKRRTSKEIPPNVHDELAGKLNDLTLGPRAKYDPATPNGTASRRHSIVSTAGADYDYLEERKIVDDRMLTPCSENGKHKCNCDDESDTNHRSSSSISPQEPRKLDERRLKEIAKYKRRLRKEIKLKLCDSTSSEGDGAKRETHTSIPILQASRFDRFRAIGCFRNRTYLTLPASRIEGRSPFAETPSLPPAEFRRTNTVGTQTEEERCGCGEALPARCARCPPRPMVRSDGTYDLAALENGARRKRDEDDKALKKHKCDSSQCDTLDNSSYKSDILKRPKLRRYFPKTERIERVMNDRMAQNNDIRELNLRDDDTVFCVPKPEAKRQKTFSIGDDYVCYEKCDYGTVDEYDADSPKNLEEFKFPDPRRGADNQVPSPTEMDRFRWRFDSATSMVFHNKTGLPLTSSPAPLRRGNNCFDFDDSINGVSGIKSALFHPAPVSPPAHPAPPASPVSPAPAPPAPRTPARPRLGPSTGLLGSFEESALKGRLEPVATVHGFTAELGASGAFCPPHRRLPVTVFFYAPGGTNAPYMGHINLGSGGYRVARSGTVQVSLFNPHGTLVKMFVVLYDLTNMPPMARTFLRQRTLYMPAGADPPAPHHMHKWLRYLIHLRFMTSKSGKLYLHTDIRIIVSRKADLDTATAHSALFRPIPNQKEPPEAGPSRAPNRVFGGCSEFDSEVCGEAGRGEICGSVRGEVGSGEVCGIVRREAGRGVGVAGRGEGVSYELRSFTYAPENPKYSPR